VNGAKTFHGRTVTLMQMASHRVLHFRIGTEHYCLSVLDIEQVVQVTDLRTVPNSPDFSAGVEEPEGIGESVEFLDPGVAFGIRGERETRQDGLVLGESYTENDRRLGWLVDEVLSVEIVERGDVDEEVKEDGVLGGVEFEDEDEPYAVWLDTGELFDLETEYVTD